MFIMHQLYAANIKLKQFQMEQNSRWIWLMFMRCVRNMAGDGLRRYS